MVLLSIILWLISALLTVAVVSVAERHLEQRTLEMFEIVLVFIFWPYFLVAVIVKLNFD